MIDNDINFAKKNRQKVHEKCIGEGFSDTEIKALRAQRCSHIEDITMADDDGNTMTEFFCDAYMSPEHKWTNNKRCPLAEHFRPDLLGKDKEKTRVGQQKQKKKK